MIKKVEQRIFKELFHIHIQRDFEKIERRPLSMLDRLHRRGLYDFFTLNDDRTGEILAYAGLLHMPEIDTELLDYFAVIPEYRNKNIGSEFLKDIASKFDISGILIECESPEYTNDIKEKGIRNRRIFFYLRNGAEETGFRMSYLGVGYELLWFPIKKNADNVDIENIVLTASSSAIPSWLARIITPFLRKGIRKI